MTRFAFLFPLKQASFGNQVVLDVLEVVLYHSYVSIEKGYFPLDSPTYANAT